MISCPARDCPHEEHPLPGDTHNWPLTPQNARLLEHVAHCPHVAEELRRLTERE